EVRGLPLPCLERGAQILFLTLRALEHRHVGLHDEHVDAERQHRGEGDDHRPDPDRQRPAAGGARIERLQLLDDAHCTASASSARDTCCANTVNWELRAWPCEIVSTTSRPGSRSHSELSMLRISAETRVLDCAAPLISTRACCCFS